MSSATSKGRRPPAATVDFCEAPTHPPLVPAPDDETLAAMAKALGHPARIKILRLLAHRDTCMNGDVVAELPLAQSTVSEHLRVLREAGLVQGEIEGPRTRYCISGSGLAALKAGVASLGDLARGTCNAPSSIRRKPPPQHQPDPP